VKVQNANTAAAGDPRVTGWCLGKEDLCVAKLIALREKDQNFVRALLNAGLLDPDVVASRLRGLPAEHAERVQRPLDWLNAGTGSYRTTSVHSQVRTIAGSADEPALPPQWGGDVARNSRRP
jgi:hypothetical protein